MVIVADAIPYTPARREAMTIWWSLILPQVWVCLLVADCIKSRGALCYPSNILVAAVPSCNKRVM